MENNNKANMSTNIGLHPIIFKLLSKRGMNKAEIEEFLSWNLKSLPNLTDLLDLKKAALRIINAIDNKEKIAIYGDYDVDGTTSCALLYHFFQLLNIEVMVIQPSRFDEGYGLHTSLIDKAIEKQISLLITVDCGITNNEAIDYGNDRNLDIIITDHHTDAKETLPKAFSIINPSRRDEPKDSPLKALAGVGVAFTLALKVKEELKKIDRDMPSIYDLLQFVAIGTICDLAPINNINARLIKHGLKQIKTTNFPGIKVFFSPEERKFETIPSEKLSFNVGPLINSKGRLEHAEKAFDLLTCNDSETAFSLYSQLEICNNERKYLQAEVLKSAKNQIKSKIASDDHIINIVYDPSWHEGVVGIVASRLVEEFKAPAIVFTNSKDEGFIKGSARSAGSLNLIDALTQVSGLFTKFGGHKAAAGMTMHQDNFQTLHERLKKIIHLIPYNLRTIQESFDIEISASDVSPKLAKNLEMVEPFGVDNPIPIFKIKDIKLDSYDILKDVHVRWSFSQIGNPSKKFRGISFNYIGHWGKQHPKDIYEIQNRTNCPIEILFNLGINRFNGNEYVQLNVKKINTLTLG